MTGEARIDAGERVQAELREQAALRHVATLVAEGTTSSELFAAVVAEAARALDADTVALGRYEPDAAVRVLASLNGAAFTTDSSWKLDGPSIAASVLDTGRPSRIDDYSQLPGSIAAGARESKLKSTVGVPIVVDGIVWGVMATASMADRPLPLPGTDVRLARFAGLIATAVSNATARSELLASRARIVAAGDEARKRIERSLHDGPHQRLLAIGLDVQRIQASVSAADDVRIGLERVSRDLESVLEDLRELSRGLHPQMLSRRGLRAALVALARHSPIPVDLDIELDERPPEQIETSVYYAVSEALTNAIKHSNASAISVRIATDHPGGRLATGLDEIGGGLHLHVTVADDGDGGAAPARGAGLAGLVDRIDALGGRLSLESPPGQGTRIAIALPLTSRAQP